MANHLGRDSRVLAGEYNLDWLTGWDVTRDQDPIDVTVINADATSNDREYIAGLMTGTVSLNGFWEVDAGKSGPVAATLMDGSLHAVTVCPQGAAAVGERCVVLNVRQTGSPMSSTVDGAVELSTSRQGSAAVRGGVVLKDYASETSTGNFASVDNAGSSAFGAVANLHVTAFDGTNAVVKVTDSTDDAAFADHITFTTVTGITSERATSTGTVNRYARIELTGTFTSLTFTVGFARHLQ